MGMVKLISPSGWDWDCPVASLVKVASGGLKGRDRTEFIKRASGSENIFLPYLDRVKFAADEEPVHLIALGASEAYGPNRNGDGFKEAALKATHKSFVKYAKFYRNHKNKEPEISYGVVKLSAYNPVMRRVELLCALNREKSAAERNRGFVADKELEKLARGEDIPVSMACRVPFDVCSYCGNKARTREEYCTEKMCKAGGCKNNLTKLVKDGADVHILHVDNPHPTFFDISHVFRPADRIAYANKADWYEKRGSDAFLSGVKAAEYLEVQAPLAVILEQDRLYGLKRKDYSKQVKIAHGLAELERYTERDGYAAVKLAFCRDIQEPIDWNNLEVDTQQPTKVAELLAAFADCKVILPLREYAHLTKRAEHISQAQALLPGMVGRLIDSERLLACLENNPYPFQEKLASSKQRVVAMRVQHHYGLDKYAVDTRVQKASLRLLDYTDPRDLKTGFYIQTEAQKLAEDYLAYKIAALERIAEYDDDFVNTSRYAVVQNYVV